jgi:DNA polymerase III delta subunit
MLTLVTGPDAYLARAAVGRIRETHDADGFNTTTLDARSSSISEITAAVGTPGFFGTTRVVIVSDLMTIASKGAASEDVGDALAKTGKFSVDWEALFGAIQPSNIAVFVDRDLSSVPAAVKRAAPSRADIVLGDPPRSAGLVAWMKDQAKESGSSIADMDARVLAELLSPGTWSAKPSNPAYDRPPDLDLFANEIAKLALAAHPEPIGRQTIATMSAAGQADRLFPLIDSVIASEGATAIRELAVAMSNGDDAGRIGAQLYQQIELIAAMDAAGKLDPAEAGRSLGLQNPNRMVNVSRGMRSMRGRPAHLLAEAVETERQLKTGVLRKPVDHIYAIVERSLSSARRTTESGT